MQNVEIKQACKPTVYLCGPIGGLTWEEANTWRENIIKLIQPCIAISPLRDMDGISIRSSCFVEGGREGINDQNAIPFHKLFQRDYMDAHTCDAMFINMLGANKKSVGSLCEIAWAYRRGIPMFMAIDPNDEMHNHPFITCQVSRRYPTLADAINGLREYYGLPTYEAGSAD